MGSSLGLQDLTRVFSALTIQHLQIMDLTRAFSALTIQHLQIMEIYGRMKDHGFNQPASDLGDYSTWSKGLKIGIQQLQ